MIYTLGNWDFDSCLLALLEQVVRFEFQGFMISASSKAISTACSAFKRGSHVDW